jgi:bifunctional DNA-binding transcriptional regulator/antitoxin component of YhaV-PrlF toxin-antitoxin module
MGTSYQHVRGVLVRSSSAAHPREPESERDLETESGRAEVDATGAVHLPLKVLERLGLRPGRAVPWRVEGDEIVLLSPAAGWRRAQEIARKYPVPGGKLASDLLLEERRAEVRRDRD